MIKLLGRGNAFSEENTSAYFIKDEILFLFDCGETVFKALKKLNLFDNIKGVRIFLTHLHSDHSGSIGTVLFYLAARNIPKDNVYVFFPDKEQLYTLLKIFDVHDLCNYMTDEDLKNLNISYYKQKHYRIFSYGYLIKSENTTIYFSGDTEEIPATILTMLLNDQIDMLYIDTCFDINSEYHISYKKIKELIPSEYRKKVTCVHLKDGYNKELISDFNNTEEI